MNASPAPTVSTTSTGRACTRADPACAHRERAALAHRHRDDRRAQPQPCPRHLLGRAVRVDPVQVLVAGLDDIAPLDETVDSAARLFVVLDQRRPHIGVERDRGRDVVGVQQRRGGPAARLQHGGDRARVRYHRRCNLGRARQLPVDVENVLRRSAFVQRRQRCRGVIRACRFPKPTPRPSSSTYSVMR